LVKKVSDYLFPRNLAGQIMHAHFDGH